MGRVIFYLLVIWILYEFPCYAQNSSINDLVFLVERSSNVTETQYEQIVDFIYNFTTHLNFGKNGSAVSVITFSSSVRIEFTFNDVKNRKDVLRAITRLKELKTGGESDYKLAKNVLELYSFQEEHGARYGANKVVIVLSMNSFEENLFQELKSRNTSVIVVELDEVFQSMRSGNMSRNTGHSEFFLQVVCHTQELIPLIYDLEVNSTDCTNSEGTIPKFRVLRAEIVRVAEEENDTIVEELTSIVISVFSCIGLISILLMLYIYKSYRGGKCPKDNWC